MLNWRGCQQQISCHPQPPPTQTPYPCYTNWYIHKQKEWMSAVRASELIDEILQYSSLMGVYIFCDNISTGLAALYWVLVCSAPSRNWLHIQSRLISWLLLWFIYSIRWFIMCFFKISINIGDNSFIDVVFNKQQLVWRSGNAFHL